MKKERFKNNKFVRLILKIEKKSIEWKARNGMQLLRVCLGIVFIWFGALKFFPGLSPAENIAGITMTKLTFGLIKPAFSMRFLAIWECTIGVGLISKSWLSLTLLLLYFQMIGTFLPLVFFPDKTFVHSVLVPTLLGQYIVKNIVLVSSAIVIGATAKGGFLTAHPKDELKPDKYQTQKEYSKSKTTHEVLD